jgi:phosphoglucosamine mutase
MSQLFGTDGVRGTVGQWPLVSEFALALGRAAGAVLAADTKRPAVLVGRDTRLSGPMLQSALVAGLLAAGVEVIDLGVLTTPGVSWLIQRLGAVAGAVISASHNPVEQNGIKFFDSRGMKLAESVEEEIERLIESASEPTGSGGNVRRGNLSALGRVIGGHAFTELYVRGLLDEHHDLQLASLKIVMDCANGAASAYAPDLFARVGARVVAVNASPTGLNINVEAGSEEVRHHPGRVKSLIETYDADFGLAFDGDADRAIFVDQRGTVIDGDHMLGMLARYFDNHRQLLARSVVTTNMRNGGLTRYVEDLGLQMHETPVGDKYVAEKLIELRNASTGPGQIGLGGEQSGHVVLLDDEHATGDGMRTALFVMRAYLESGAASMAEFAAGIGKTPQVIASADVGYDKALRFDKAALAGMEQEVLAANPGLARVNLRYSGTEPKFRAMLESEGGQSEEDLAAIATKVCRRVQARAGLEGAAIEIQDCSRGGLLSPKN